MELVWKEIHTSALPERGKRILLCANNAFPVPEVVVGCLLHDDEFYWDVENDQQYAVNEYWTHWAYFELPFRA